MREGGNSCSLDGESDPSLRTSQHRTGHSALGDDTMRSRGPVQTPDELVLPKTAVQLQLT